MLKIAICDDDSYFTGSLEALLLQEASAMSLSIETEVFFDGSTLTSNILNGNRYEIIFLDIEMKKVNGIDAAHSIRETDKLVLLIYISGYEHYLKELFEVEPFRFLSKPLNIPLFRQYFKDAYYRIIEADAYYQFNFNKEIRKVILKHIIYFESRNRVIHIVLKDGKEEQFYGKLNDVEKEFLKSKRRFIRIHQSYLINYDYVKSINFCSATINIGLGKVMRLKISEERQRNIRNRLCEIASGKAVIE